MDAVKFLEEEGRMCNKYKYSSDYNCANCPCRIKNNGTGEICISLRKKHPQKYVSIIEKWSYEHPVKTRQSEFLKMYPNVELEDGVIKIRPCLIDTEIKDDCSRLSPCFNCQKKYWLAEIE